MKLQKREIRVILGGAAIVIAVWLYQSLPSFGAAAATGDSIGAMLVRINDFDRVSKSLKTQADKLHVAIPVAGPAEQEAMVRETLGKLAQSSGVQLSSIKRQDKASRLTAAASAIDFQLDAAGNYESMLKFVNALESDRTPFQVTEMRVESGRGGGSGGGGGPGGQGGPSGPGGRSGGPSGGGQRNADGNVQSTLKVRSYLFAKVIEEKKAPKPTPTPAPSTPSRGPESTPEPTPAAKGPAPAKETPKATPTPTPTPEIVEAVATPKPAGGPRRFTMKMGGMDMKVTVDGRTATITMPDGTEQKKELSDDEYKKFQDGSFMDEIKKSGGEVTEE